MARASFDGDELAIVLSQFDLDPIGAIVPYERGSADSPKVVVKTRSAEYLLKRRSGRSADAERVRFVHAIHRFLQDRGYPVARLQSGREGLGSTFERNDYIYELTEFVRGETFDKSIDEARDAGRRLAEFHAALAQAPPEFAPQSLERVGPGSYHDALGVRRLATRAGRALREVDRSVSPDAAHALLGELMALYDDAANRVDAIGFDRWPRMIVHGDWHPGNMIFQGRRVIAVIDFDSARVEPRITDVANGLLHFSMRTRSTDPATWPDDVNPERARGFAAGYDAFHADFILSRVEIEATPWLMIESLIAEVVAPIAQRGRFGSFRGFEFLEMIRRKASWIATHADEIVPLIDA